MYIYNISYSGCLPYFRMYFQMLALFPDVFPDACLISGCLLCGRMLALTWMLDIPINQLIRK